MENKKLGILAIDDNVDNLRGLEAMLRDAFPEFSFASALNGPEGIKLAIANNPDVILLDILMPKMDGFEVCQLLKNDERVSDIPVVFITGIIGDNENRIRALEVGAEAFVSKPFGQLELAFIIKAMVKIKAANEQKRNETNRLNMLVAERTHKLEQSQQASLNLLEKLKNENAARKKSEEALLESEERYHSLFIDSPDAIMILTPEDGFLDANPATIKMFACTDEEDFKYHTPASLSPEYQPDGTKSEEGSLAMMNLALKNGSHFFEWLHRRVNGTEFPATVLLSRFTKEGSRMLQATVRDITNQKQFEKALIESEERFQLLFNQAPLGYQSLDFDGHFIEVNQKWLDTLGYSREEVIGKWFGDFLSPNNRDGFKKRFPVFKALGHIHSEFEMIHKNGSLLFIAFEGKVGYDPKGDFKQTHCILQDITDRKIIELELISAKEEAEKSEKNLKLRNEELIAKNTFIQIILDNLPIGVALNKIDEGTATYMNKKFEEIYGWNYNELTSIASFFEKVYPDTEYRNALTERVMFDIQSGDPERMHWENLTVTRKDGTNRVINAVNIPLMEQNTMVSTVIDITDLHSIQNDLVAAKERAEESDRLKSAFLANMSHEIRTPMNSIMGFASLLPEEENKDLMANYANIIVRSSEQLLHIIDDIVLYSRLQTRLLSFQPSPFNVQNLLTDVKLSFNLPDYQKGVELNIETDSELPVWIRSDYEKIRQIFTNLVSNAYKYTCQGSITIGFSSNDFEMDFFVKDTGMGIQPDELEKVFERFFRGSNVNKGVIGGTGLGLSIVKELAELLGGKIWVESEIYKGSAFHFTIPVTKQD